MALNAYITAVQTLLHDPNAQFFTTATLTTFINEARQQIALEGECIRGVATVSTVNGTEVYLHASITPPAAPTGISALLNVRSLSFNSLTMESRPWDWFNFYNRNLAKPANGVPKAWCPFQQGSNGSFYLSPIPDNVYAVSVDGVWTPINLAVDADPEAIPFPWTDAIQFYAVYLALKDSQRALDADKMFGIYENYMMRARGGVTPLVTPSTHPGGIAARVFLPGAAPPQRAPQGSQPQAGKG